jgi:hypothetical protein
LRRKQGLSERTQFFAIFERMDIQATRLELIKLLLEEKQETVLKKVHQLLSNEEEIVAYTGSGKPLSRKEYNKRLAEAEKQIERGEYLTQEELEKQAKTW